MTYETDTKLARDARNVQHAFIDVLTRFPEATAKRVRNWTYALDDLENRQRIVGLTASYLKEAELMILDHGTYEKYINHHEKSKRKFVGLPNSTLRRSRAQFWYFDRFSVRLKITYQDLEKDVPIPDEYECVSILFVPNRPATHGPNLNALFIGLLMPLNLELVKADAVPYLFGMHTEDPLTERTGSLATLATALEAKKRETARAQQGRASWRLVGFSNGESKL